MCGEGECVSAHRVSFRFLVRNVAQPKVYLIYILFNIKLYKSKDIKNISRKFLDFLVFNRCRVFSFGLSLRKRVVFSLIKTCAVYINVARTRK